MELCLVVLVWIGNLTQVVNLSEERQQILRFLGHLPEILPPHLKPAECGFKARCTLILLGSFEGNINDCSILFFDLLLHLLPV